MKIAIVKLSALGDIVHALLALQFIKAHTPEIQIDWLVEQRFAELLAHQPDIHQVLTINLKGLKQNKRLFFAQYQQLKHYAQNHYDFVIDAQGLIKSAISARLLAQRVIGFDKNSIREKPASYFYSEKIACPYHENTIIRNLTVLTQPFNITVTHEQILNKQPFLYFTDSNTKLNPLFSDPKKTILFVTQSTWASRNYPAECFIELANRLQQNGLLLWGNDTEKQQAELMAQQSPYLQVLPALSLNELKAVIAQVDLVIGNDTGPTHIAWAMNKPSITLFGCTPVSRVYQTPINKVLKSGSIVNPYKLNKQDYSIKDIPVTAVLELAESLLF